MHHVVNEHTWLEVECDEETCCCHHEDLPRDSDNPPWLDKTADRVLLKELAQKVLHRNFLIIIICHNYKHSYGKIPFLFFTMISTVNFLPEDLLGDRDNPPWLDKTSPLKRTCPEGPRSQFPNYNMSNNKHNYGNIHYFFTMI
jgi:hypothetical protein